MRIAILTDTFVPKVDGIVTTLCQTIRQLRALGHEVIIFAPEGGVREFDGFRIVGMKSWKFALYPDLRLAFPRASMRQVLIDFKPDVIHVAEPALLGIAGLYYAGGKNGGALRLPLVTSYHTDLPKYLHYYGLQFLEPWVWQILRIRHNRATVNLATSHTMVQQLTEHGIERVAFWPGGVDTDLFQPSRRSAAMRDRLSQGHPDSPLLLYIGRLSAEKDLESLRPMLDAFPSARLALVGDGPHRLELEEYFAGMNVYMAGFLHGEELASAYASADVFIMPSRTETLGLVVLEAMASGLPVVAARAGGIPEMIEDGISGILYDQEQEAIEAIRDFLHSPERCRTVGAAAIVRSSQLSWKAATLQLVAQYEVACATQHIGHSSDQTSADAGLRYRLKRLWYRAILAILRKLLP